MRDEFGKSGGAGPTRGRTAAVYEVTLPDGRVMRKRKFGDARNPNPTFPDTAPASVCGLADVGRLPSIVVWLDRAPAWVGDVPGLTARRIK